MDQHIERNSVEALKGFLLLSGNFEDVVTSLETRISSRKSNQHTNLRRIVNQLRDIIVTCQVMGIMVMIHNI